MVLPPAPAFVGVADPMKEKTDAVKEIFESNIEVNPSLTSKYLKYVAPAVKGEYALKNRFTAAPRFDF